MAELIGTFGAGTVIIILLIAIPAIVNFISWCKKIWSTREKFKEENIQKGKKIEAETEQKEARLVKHEDRIKLLEDNLIEMKKINEAQSKELTRLRKSDRLAIKTWIKE